MVLREIDGEPFVISISKETDTESPLTPSNISDIANPVEPVLDAVNPLAEALVKDSYPVLANTPLVGVFTKANKVPSVTSSAVKDFTASSELRRTCTTYLPSARATVSPVAAKVA